jgi:chloramphenicol-sensitive protein RarD
MGRARTGYLFGIAAYLGWGLFPLYWKLLEPAGALEILAHRILWSLVLVAIVVTIGRRWGAIRALLRQRRRVGLIGLASALIAVNWGTYIYGVGSGRVVETSLGYFINPLVTVLLGVFVLGERLRAVQWVAIAVGGLAVGVLTIDYGHVPWLALTLALSFGLYGLVKKRLGVAAVDGLTVESGALALPALVYVIVLGGHGGATFGQDGVRTGLLILGGAVTAIPLLLFAGAANRIPLSTIGLLQYLAPILQLGCGVLVFHEPMPLPRLAGFALVWLALGIFAGDGIRQVRLEGRRTAIVGQPAAVRP